MLKSTRFHASDHAPDQRLAAWSACLGRIGGSVVPRPQHEAFGATFELAAAPWGFVLGRLDIAAQRLTLETSRFAGGLWLMHVVDGAATLSTERGSCALTTDALLYGKAARELTLDCPGHLTLQCVFFPRSGAGARLASVPTPVVAGDLLPGQGSSEFLRGLLSSATAKLPQIALDEIRPLETAITEFLFAAVVATSAARSPIEGSRGRNAIVLRATQLLEAQLCDPELSPTTAAQQLGISVRYLQKLFEEAGENVNRYIRRRRLERSYAELIDPLYRQQSISEVSFRWGFNDSAYFSRSFRGMFGLSPSQHRDRWLWRRTKPASKRPPAHAHAFARVAGRGA